MPIVVSLKDVVQALEALGEGRVAYLNPDTGEILTVSDEERQLVEDEVEPADLPEWQREVLPKVREALESHRFLVLPDRFEVHEWSIMEKFANGRIDSAQRGELLDAIHGAGAFRAFRASVRRLGTEDEWYRFRDGALERIAREWLDAQGLAYR